jgi:hypothetical protein
MQEISENMGLKYEKVVYLMKKFNIPRRSRSDASYLKHNPNGDPFKIKKKLTKKDLELRGLGVGLYWGEGNKTSEYSVRVGNTDAALIKKFREFLLEICGVDEKKIKYSLQVFNDADPSRALHFWTKKLKISRNKIGKITIIPPVGKGTYKKKNQFGVLIIYFHNVKLKRIIDKWVQEISN